MTSAYGFVGEFPKDVQRLDDAALDRLEAAARDSFARGPYEGVAAIAIDLIAEMRTLRFEASVVRRHDPGKYPRLERMLSECGYVPPYERLLA